MQQNSKHNLYVSVYVVFYSDIDIYGYSVIDLTYILFHQIFGYFASAVNIVSSNPCVGSSLRIKISFSVLSICTDELKSVSKIMIFFPKLPSVNKNSEQESNPMP